jgi:hypothetical protein
MSMLPLVIHIECKSPLKSHVSELNNALIFFFREYLIDDERVKYEGCS